MAAFAGGIPDTSALAVTVPGVVDAWAQLSERFGRLGLRRVLEPARSLASSGFPIGRLTAPAWSGATERLRPGSPYPATVRASERFANPTLAASLGQIAHGGPLAHYRGPWATAAVAAVGQAGGVLTESDLAAHQGEWVSPIRGEYRGYDVYQHPPNGQGAAVLAALAQRDAEESGTPEDPETVVRTMAAIRTGMEQAHRHVADPRFSVVPEFWSWSAEVTPDEAARDEAARDEAARATAAGADTVFTAVVAGGMAVSLISSVFYLFGSGITAGGAALQNRGVGFSLDLGHPNVVAGGKRPFHTIIPAMLRRGGRTWAALGVVGGPMQPQGQVQVISHLVDHGRDPQAALDAPRARWLGANLIALEGGFGPEVSAALTAEGWRVLDRPLPGREAGAGQVVRVHDDGWLEGGADRRRDGEALGY
jgi:gamma-glutamyltranspeptidase/glutathione hydrolase